MMDTHANEKGVDEVVRETGHTTDQLGCFFGRKAERMPEERWFIVNTAHTRTRSAQV